MTEAIGRREFVALHERLASAVIKIDEGSPLWGAFQDGGLLSASADLSIFPHVLTYQEWWFDEMKGWAASLQDAEYHLYDIGANIGLFARQALIGFPQIKSAACFEPSPENFGHLDANLKGIDTAWVHPYGLHRDEGVLKFYRDRANGGNYSFNPSAVEGRPHDVIEAEIRTISTALLDAASPPAAAARRKIWKSDTQGLDEILIAEMPTAFWDDVDVMLFEGWRIDKPDYDRDKLRAALSAFPYAYRSRPKRRRVVQMSTDEILEFLSGDDRSWVDFTLMRAPLAT